MIPDIITTLVTPERAQRSAHQLEFALTAKGAISLKSQNTRKKKLKISICYHCYQIF